MFPIWAALIELVCCLDIMFTSALIRCLLWETCIEWFLLLFKNWQLLKLRCCWNPQSSLSTLHSGFVFLLIFLLYVTVHHNASLPVLKYLYVWTCHRVTNFVNLYSLQYLSSVFIIIYHVSANVNKTKFKLSCCWFYLGHWMRIQFM